MLSADQPRQDMGSNSIEADGRTGPNQAVSDAGVGKNKPTVSSPEGVEALAHLAPPQRDKLSTVVWGCG